MKHRTRALLLGLIVAAVLTAGCVGSLPRSGSKVTISGTIIDETNSLPFIDLYLDDTGKRVSLSGGQAAFSFTVPAGSYELWAWKTGTGAVAPIQVQAHKDTVVDLEISPENLTEFDLFYTHHAPGTAEFYLSKLGEEFTALYGPSLNNLREELTPEELTKSWRVVPNKPVIGGESFLKIQFHSDRPDLYVPVFFLEQPVIASPQNGAAVSSPFTITWEPVPGADNYTVTVFEYGTDFPPSERVTKAASYTLDEELSPGTYEVWVTAFKWLDGGLSAESMAQILIELES